MLEKSSIKIFQKTYQLKKYLLISKINSMVNLKERAHLHKTCKKQIITLQLRK